MQEWDGSSADLHLQVGSPCIDAGSPDTATAFNDRCLPPGLGAARNDMGAYGGPDNCGWLDHDPPPTPTPTVTNTPLPTTRYDLWPEGLPDGHVDARDLVRLVHQLQEGGSGSLYDFSRFWHKVQTSVKKAIPLISHRR